MADNINHRVVRYGPAPALHLPRALGRVRPRPRTAAVPARAGRGRHGADVRGRSGRQPDRRVRHRRDLAGLVREVRTRKPASSSGRSASARTPAARARSPTRSTAASSCSTPTGSVAAMFGAPAPGPTLLPDPVAVAFDGAGLVYVLDQQRSRVLVFDRGGKIIRTIGIARDRPGPAARAVRAGRRRRGRLYVADTGNGRIVRFTVGGTHSGLSAASARSAASPCHRTARRVYGADAGTNRITVLTGTGGDLAEIGARRAALPRGARARRRRQRVGRGPRQRPRARVHPGRDAGGVVRRARRRAPASSSSRPASRSTATGW